MFINRSFNNIFDDFIDKEYSFCRKVLCINPITLYFIIFESAAQAGRVLGLSKSHITSSCQGKVNYLGGYYWRYLDDYIKINNNHYIKCYPESNDLFNNKFTCDAINLLVYNNLSNYISPCFSLLPGEILKDIPQYEGLYQASNYGRIVNIKDYPYIYEMKFQIDKGYCRIQLTDNDGNRKKFSIHRLVAITFIPNPFNLPCVNHKDEIKLNNRVDNLEWCTHEYNNSYGTRLERIGKIFCKMANKSI